MHIRLGSRKSHLAQFQVYEVKKRLEDLGHRVEVYLKPSFGDLNLDMDLSKTDNKGVFTKDFFELLKKKEVSAVVHSWKDLPIENNETTVVKATLKREDTRDLILVKKNSLSKKLWTCLTSSPRREFNLSSLFTYLSDGEQNFKYKSIRGNIPTRFKKFLEDESADVFCVALAAVKRLLEWKDFNEEHPKIWDEIEKLCTWAVLPESYCPSAAAQGALAIEVLRDNTELLEVLDSLNEDFYFSAVQREREILKTFGGGCHLAVGASILKHKLGELEFVSGFHEGKTIREQTWRPNKAYPSRILNSELWVSSEQAKASRKSLKTLPSFEGSKSLVVTRHESFKKTLFDETQDVLFCSGVRTWKKLYQEGLWVNGCMDSLGEEFYVKDLFKKSDHHLWLTRKGAPKVSNFTSVETYDLEVNADPKTYEGKTCFAWMSGQFFLEEFQKHEILRDKKHFFGLGRSQDEVFKNQASIESLSRKGFELHSFYDLKQLKKDLLIRE